MNVSFRPVAPGGTIGVLGGGQLGRMLALSAAQLGFKVLIYSPEAKAPAFDVASSHLVAGFDDGAALRAFAKSCDVVTFEFENIPAESIEAVAEIATVFPSAATLRVTQDRFAEKSFINRLGLTTAPFIAVDSAAEAVGALAQLGGGGILKTRRMGYDGKGQAKIASLDDAAAAFARFNQPCILEGFIDFAFEASVVAARGRDGSFAAYDPPQNMHAHHILHRSIVPSPLSATQVETAKAMAHKIADALDYVGVIAVELFVTRDGALLVNELAPRVHNSGHWTMEACQTSQFEQHIRAIAGWPLGSAARHSDAEMTNLIGDDVADWQALASQDGALHLYGKSEIRAGRKMGHITRLILKDASR